MKGFRLEGSFGNQLGIAVRRSRPLPLRRLGAWVKDLPPPPANAIPAPTPTPEPAATVYPCPEMTYAEWQAADKAELAAWQATGGTTVRGGCAIVVQPDGRKEPLQACYWPGMPGGGGNVGGGGGTAPSGENPAGTPGAAYNAQTGGPGMSSCDEKWKWICENIGGPNDPWKQYCPGHSGASGTTPTPAPTPAPAPAPAPTPTPAPSGSSTGTQQPSGTLSIDIQAFTPGYAGYGPGYGYGGYGYGYGAQGYAPAAPSTAAASTADTASKGIRFMPVKTEDKKPGLSELTSVGLAALLVAAAAFGMSLIKK